VTYKAYAVSWNLTQRCNLFCAHCYISAAPGASAAGELSTDVSSGRRTVE
jgi:MoaA/NifB/PqqE/SkfB family radical SAM enzyme